MAVCTICFLCQTIHKSVVQFSIEIGKFILVLLVDIHFELLVNFLFCLKYFLMKIFNKFVRKYNYIIQLDFGKYLY